jgi:hypothetical protein
MGDRQSVVVLGGWYLYKNSGAVNTEHRLLQVRKVMGDRVNVMVYWADVDAHGYADKKYLTPLPEGLKPILSDSILKGEAND